MSSYGWRLEPSGPCGHDVRLHFGRRHVRSPRVVGAKMRVTMPRRSDTNRRDSIRSARFSDVLGLSLAWHSIRNSVSSRGKPPRPVRSKKTGKGTERMDASRLLAWVVGLVAV